MFGARWELEQSTLVPLGQGRKGSLWRVFFRLRVLEWFWVLLGTPAAWPWMQGVGLEQ